MELLQVDESKGAIWTWPVDALSNAADSIKLKGMEYFKSGLFSAALHEFGRSLQAIIMCEIMPVREARSKHAAHHTTPTSLPVKDNLRRLPLYLNLASCWLKLMETSSHDDHSRRDYATHAAANCTKALSIDPSNTKALYRRGVAFRSLGSLEQAIQDLQSAHHTSPADQLIAKELECTHALSMQKKAALAKSLAGMFGGPQ